MWKYNPVRMTGIAVDKTGNLCYNAAGKVAKNANTGVVAHHVERPSYLARAFMRSTADAAFDATKAAAVRAANDTTKRAALTASGAFKGLGLHHAVTHLPEARYTKLTAHGVSSGTSAFTAALTRWNFLEALAAAPALCHTKGEGSLRGKSASAICARDLAALWAAMAATTNARDVAKAKVDVKTGKATLRYGQQGFLATHDACKDSAGKAWANASTTQGRYQRCNETKLASPAWSLVADAGSGKCTGNTLCGAGTANKYFPAGPLAL